ncbi:type IV secretory system conjugative DNA transfer family protein [Streptomonospora sp. S1-112]|uniref:Type IV secretory system conjugative DNA transfer family protein n=1 Tax=Streptomonospora mangrovi TaxID=2883123 RepID=A0A9X3NN86_9ACTN|nr:type IV secretory system conjugative DNA transfer family protein [Streptomonospora mangrovi]MDA0565156.1 type IV secretory system conjugative DNA transfer family protein [Streptomonospora mangrovi]
MSWLPADLSGLPAALGELVLAAVAAHGSTALAAAPCAIAAAVALRTAVALLRHRAWSRHARLVEILPPPETDLAGAEALWTNLLGLLRPAWKRALLGQPHVVWEYAVDGSGVRVRLWVPGPVPPGMVERAVQAAWPGASTTTRPVPPPEAAPRARGGHLRLARPDHYPIATGHAEDPIRPLLGAAGGLAPGERVLVQVAVRPVTGRRLRRAAQAAARLRQGVRPTGGVFDLVTPGGAHRKAAQAALRPDVPGEVRAILAKAMAPRLETHVRYLVTGPGADTAARQRRRGRSHAVAGAFSVFTGLNHYRRRWTPIAARLAATRWLGHGDMLSAKELAAVAHLPLDTAVPGLERAPARPTPPPPGITGDAPDTRLLGTADGPAARLVGLRVADARHHTHVIGGTGTGKTTFLLNMILDDAAKGRGLVFIEPKGESELLLSRLPMAAAERVVLIDPDDNAPPPALNVLSADARGRERAADMVTGIFRRIFADSWGPRTEDILRSACLTLAGTPHAGLANIPRLLDNTAFRRRATARLADPVLKGFWNWYEDLSEPARAHATAPLANKLRSVLLRGFARDLLATTDHGLDLRRLLDNQAIVIARLPKGVLGEDTASLLGSLLLAQVWNAVLARARQAENQRADIAIYLDECQNFLTLPYGIDDMLAEARAYRAGLVLAHQDLSQLPRDLREAVSANARNKVYFDVSPEDARTLARHVHPNLGEHDLSHLAAHQAAARLVSHGALSPAFTLRTRPLPPPVKGRATALRKAARTHR